MSKQDERMRKFAEAGGWRYVGPRHWISPSGYRKQSEPDYPNNLPSCFEVLERVCDERGAFAEITVSGIKSCQPKWRYFCRFAGFDAHYGTTKQEAIISAVLSAVEGK